MWKGVNQIVGKCKDTKRLIEQQIIWMAKCSLKMGSEALCLVKGEIETHI